MSSSTRFMFDPISLPRPIGESATTAATTANASMIQIGNGTPAKVPSSRNEWQSSHFVPALSAWTL